MRRGPARRPVQGAPRGLRTRAGYQAALTSSSARLLSPPGSSSLRVKAPSGVRGRPWWSWNSTIASVLHPRRAVYQCADARTAAGRQQPCRDATDGLLRESRGGSQVSSLSRCS
jgi:hypothetical protein